MRVVVGRIGRPHGIRGEVTVEVRTDEPDERFAPGAVLLVDTPAGRLEVERMHWHSGRLLLTFAGVTDRNEAEALRGLLLHVDREENASPEDPEEFYDSTLVGCLVVTREGIDVGTVVEVAHLPAQDLLVVEGAFGEVLVPFVAPIVPEVDVVARRIVIEPPDGLLGEESGPSAGLAGEEPA
jgi:16S rRNA processing protein RimM